MAPATTLLVMAKAPVAGRVKTRLCPPLDPSGAAAVAEAALADTLEAVASCGAERHLLALDGEPGPWLPDGFEVVAQVDGDLGDRLEGAWAMVTGPCLQIGMDTPQVTPAGLDQALDLVGSGTPVLGPATDGGWWAIGMDGAPPGVFRGVPMSSDTTGDRQRDSMRRHGLRPVDIEVLRDIDTVVDARAVAALIPRSRTAAVVGSLLGTSAL